MSEYELTADFFDQIIERRDDGTAKRVAKHRRGAVLTGLTDREVERLTAAGAIRPHREPPQIIATGSGSGEGNVNPGAGVGGGESGQTPPDSDAAGATPQATGDGDLGNNSDEPARPAQTGAKALWVDYAVARGMEREEAEAMTRAELIEKFGN
ncbi:hypothetical protein [Nocardia asiatica]|uniref:hypothetical protein n=1 Tax=Nocardia asiatica TaxID=209252 RepID=UPI002457CA45|nr:hypothetical protein [Nocardia asiatica]